MPEREYRIGQDDEAILALRSKVWGADHPHTNPKFLQWLFRDTPNGQGAGIVHLNDASEIIGFAGICRRMAQHGAVPMAVAHGLEFMVDPAVSGMVSGRIGTQVLIAHRTMAESMGYDCSLNYPNNNSVRMLTSNRGQYQLVFEPDIFIRPLSAFSISAQEQPNALKRLIMSFGGKALSVYSSLRSLGVNRRVEIEKITDFDDRFDVFWPRLQTDGRLRFVRDAKTLNWRYVNHPLYSYLSFAAVKDGQVIGYIVISPRDVMGTKAYLICDLCAVDGETEVYEALLSQVVREGLKTNRSALVGQFQRDDERRKSLSRCGFIGLPPKLNPKQFRMVLVGFNQQGSVGLDEKNWAFNWGDMDVV